MIGWDVGGVNTKVACVAGGRVLAVRGRPYELQHAPDALVPLLRELAAEVHADPDAAAHAVTMTAELSQLFRTKTDGVAFVLDAITTAFPDGCRACVHGGRPVRRRRRGLPASAGGCRRELGRDGVGRRRPSPRRPADRHRHDQHRHHPDRLGIGGRARPHGPDRLASGELVYTGAVRTPAEAMASHVPFGAGLAGASAEGFALAGDVHVWRGSLSPADYTSPTPDGRPATREFAGERLARVVCADRDMLDDEGVSAIADALALAQVERIAAAIRRVAARHPSLRTAVVTGLGAFIASDAARAAGFDVVPLAATIGDAAARCAPAASVALLLEREVIASGRLKPAATGTDVTPASRPADVELA